MTVYYEDDDVVVCEKPYGVSSQENDGENMVNLLKTHTGCDVFCVHRLDIQTTGIMVYAKNKESAALLSGQIADGGLVKKYMCVCHGLTEGCGEMQDLLFHDRLKNKTFVVQQSERAQRKRVLNIKLFRMEKSRKRTFHLLKFFSTRVEHTK